MRDWLCRRDNRWSRPDEFVVRTTRVIAGLSQSGTLASVILNFWLGTD